MRSELADPDSAISVDDATKIVRLVVRGGLVQAAEVPEGVRIAIHDYNTDGLDPGRLFEDENGDAFVLTVLEHGDSRGYANRRGSSPFYWFV